MTWASITFAFANYQIQIFFKVSSIFLVFLKFLSNFLFAISYHFPLVSLCLYSKVFKTFALAFIMATSPFMRDFDINQVASVMRVILRNTFDLIQAIRAG